MRRVRSWVGSGIVSLLALGGPVAAWAGTPPTEAGFDPIAKQAGAILATHCYRCHGENGAAEGGFNTVLDRGRLIARKRVVPGDAARSPLVKRVEAGEMPPEDEEPRPSAAEVATLARWVKAGAPDWAPPKVRRVITVDEEAKRVREDREKFVGEPSGSSPRDGIRYLTLTPLHNAGYSDDELQTARLALAKLLNGLSWQPEIVLPEPINPERTLFRLDLRAFGWGWSDWQVMTRFGQYNAAYRPDKDALPEELPLRADWFVADASKPPRYHDVAHLPLTVSELEGRLKVDATHDIAEARVLRAGFVQSGVSRHNRMIERHQGASGYYWKSYDFASSRGRRSLLTYPLGPGPSAEGVTFQHDGGEIIFRLPNGLQGYMLADGRGNRLDRGPSEIVSDPKHPDRVVENGISCLSCHSGGFLDKDDQVRALAEVDGSPFDEDDRAEILRLYPPRATFRAALRADAEDYRAALARLGLKAGGAEPINVTSRRFEADLDVGQAAAELWLTPEEFLARLRKAPSHGTGELAALLAPGAMIKREAFEGRYPAALHWLQPILESTAQRLPARALAKGTRRVALLPGEIHELSEVRPLLQGRPVIGDDMAVDPTYALIAARDADARHVVLFDRATGELRHSLANQTTVLALTFSPDGSMLASSGPDGVVQVFGVPDGREIARTAEVVDRYHALSHDVLAFSPGGDELANPRRGLLRFLDPRTGRVLRTMPEPNSLLSALVYTRDGRLLNADGRHSPCVRATDLKTGKSVQTADVGQNSLMSMALSPDGKLIALAFANNSIRLRDAATLDEVAVERLEFEGPLGSRSTVRAVAFRPDGLVLAALHTEGAISFWTVPNLRLLGAFRAYPSDLLRSLRFSPDGRLLATCASDGTVREWDAAAMARGPDE